MVALNNRRVYAEGAPEAVMTAETVRKVFHLERECSPFWLTDIPG